MEYFGDNTYSRGTLAQVPLTKGEYDNCTFIGCDFSQADLSGMRFIQCTFANCNFSMVKVDKTVWQDVTFNECKMLGMRWDTCDPFGFTISLSYCMLGHSSFFGTKLRNSKFRHNQMDEVDFTGCDLTGVALNHCDLLGATFDNTMLEKADLSTAINYNIDPERNKIKKARFALHGLPGLLGKYDIKIDGL